MATKGEFEELKEKNSRQGALEEPGVARILGGPGSGSMCRCCPDTSSHFFLMTYEKKRSTSLHERKH